MDYSSLLLTDGTLKTVLLTYKAVLVTPVELQTKMILLSG
jgi:hypothetical protein